MPPSPGGQPLGPAGVKQLFRRVGVLHRRVADVHEGQSCGRNAVELFDPAAGTVEMQRINEDAGLGPPRRLHHLHRRV